MEILTSRQNPLCKKILRLRKSRSFRYESRLFLADGVKLVEEAVQWHADIECILLCEGISVSLPENCECVTVSKELMAYLSNMEAPEGALALIRMPETPNILPCTSMMVLDHIQDPGNVGTILRTADALSVPVVVSDGCADIYNEKVVRATMGAVFRTPVYQAGTDAVISHCREQGIPIYTAELREHSVDIRSADLRRCAVVIGNEGHGVCAAFSEAAAEHVIIPMSSRCESFNAAAAAAIFLWQLFNSREA